MLDQEMRDWNRKAGFIERNAELYQTDPEFRKMVDGTVYLTENDINLSQSETVTKYGTQWTKFATLRWAGGKS